MLLFEDASKHYVSLLYLSNIRRRVGVSRSNLLRGCGMFLRLIRLVLLCRKYGHDADTRISISDRRCNEWHWICRRCGRIVIP